MTLQILNIFNREKSLNHPRGIFLFEPVPRHVPALRHNLREYSNIKVNDYALSDHNGRPSIFTEASNHGKTSILETVAPSSEMITTKIELVDAEEYCEEINNFDSYVIEYDAQGMDGQILSRLLPKVWRNYGPAVMEVWATPEVNKRIWRICYLFVRDLDMLVGNQNLGKEMHLVK